MSTTKFFRAGLIATVGVAGLTLTANAQSRYGNVYDYESGKNCGQACVPAAPVTPQSNTRYGAPVVAAPVYSQAPTYNPAPVYVDCVQAGTCAPQAATVYTQPAPVYSQPTYTQPSYTQSVQMAPVNCPAGTTAQSDGTCMQGSSYSSGTTYSSGSTYTAPATTMMEPVNCPSGTTAQPDGTCMQGGSASYAGSSIELYTGDASTTTNTTTSYGYGADGSYGASDYLPIRK